MRSWSLATDSRPLGTWITLTDTKRRWQKHCLRPCLLGLLVSNTAKWIKLPPIRDLTILLAHRLFHLLSLQFHDTKTLHRYNRERKKAKQWMSSVIFPPVLLCAHVLYMISVQRNTGQTCSTGKCHLCVHQHTDVNTGIQAGYLEDVQFWPERSFSTPTVQLGSSFSPQRTSLKCP